MTKRLIPPIVHRAEPAIGQRHGIGELSRHHMGAGIIRRGNATLRGGASGHGARHQDKRRGHDYDGSSDNHLLNDPMLRDNGRKSKLPRPSSRGRDFERRSIGHAPLTWRTRFRMLMSLSFFPRVAGSVSRISIISFSLRERTSHAVEFLRCRGHVGDRQRTLERKRRASRFISERQAQIRCGL